jgi:enamine deaminase RidA (YjgF/YER057c/UK114 family)
MRITFPRRRFNSMAMTFTALTPAALAAQNQSKSGSVTGSGSTEHVINGVYYFSGIGANSGRSREDQVVVTDPFEKHATRAMEGVKRSIERAGCTMDSLLQVQVFTCLPHSDKVPALTGQAKFDAYTAQYQEFNKVYRGFFTSGKTPARAFMSVDWIPGNSLVEIVGCARVVGPPKNP